MLNHAELVASIAIKQQLLQDLIGAMYHNDLLPHTLPLIFPGVSGNMFLEPIRLICSTGRPTSFIIDFAARGPLTITPPGGFSSTRTILFRARMFAPPQPSIQGGSLFIRFDGASSILDYVDIDPLFGGLYPLPAQNFIESDTFKIGVENYFRQQVINFGNIIPPLDISFLGGISMVNNASVSALMANGTLLLGIDVTDVNGVTTNGSRFALTDTTDGNEIGMWTNPVALPIVLSDVRDEVEMKVIENGGTLTALNFSVREGALHISGSAEKDSYGSVDFSMDAIPRLIRPGYHEEWDEEYGEHFEITTPAREELWFEQTNVETDLNLEWWVYVLATLGSIITIGIGAFIVNAIVGMIRNNIENGISQGRAGAARVQEFNFSGIPIPKFRLKIERYECHDVGMYTGITLKPQLWAPKIEGENSIYIEHALRSTIRYRIVLPFDLHSEDPMLSIRWTVRRTDTNEIIRNIDVRANAGLVLDLTGEPLLLSVPEFKIEVRLYSTLGPITTDLFNAFVFLKITDNLDRTHPYVRWQHQVFPPNVRIEADGSHTDLGFHSVYRISAIHRTAVPGRCRMVSRYSINAPLSGTDPKPLSHIDYFDDLPFPIEDIVARRAILCDYCFFGGPDKNVPLI